MHMLSTTNSINHHKKQMGGGGNSQDEIYIEQQSKVGPIIVASHIISEK